MRMALQAKRNCWSSEWRNQQWTRFRTAHSSSKERKQ